MEIKKVLKSEDEIREFAKELLGNLKKEKDRATVIALQGNLGAGKTTFVKYLAKELGVTNHITSPTFLLIKNYKLPENSFYFENLFHIDTYRLNSPEELRSLEINKIMEDSNNLVFIEWADKVRSIIPENSIWIKLSHGESDAERIIEVMYN